MNDQDYIRTAVELADGWEIIGNDVVFSDGWLAHEPRFLNYSLPEWAKDALAAQLVKQVDALDDFWVDSDNYGTAKVWIGDLDGPKSRIAKSNDDNRSMNTIKVIVDSKVIESQ